MYEEGTVSFQRTKNCSRSYGEVRCKGKGFNSWCIYSVIGLFGTAQPLLSAHIIHQSIVA